MKSSSLYINRMYEQYTFKYGHSLRDAITRIQHDTSGSARCIKRQHTLKGYIHCRDVEDFKHNLEQLRVHSIAAPTQILFGLMYQ